MRLASLQQDAVPQANDPHRARQHPLAHRRAVPGGSQLYSDCLVTVAGAGEFEDACLQLLVPRQRGERADRHGHVERTGIAATPDKAHADRVRRAAVDDDLVNQAAQQRLLARPR